MKMMLWQYAVREIAIKSEEKQSVIGVLVSKAPHI